MNILCQQDKRWASKFLGKTKYNLGRWGCTTTGITQGYNLLFGKQKTPANVAQILDYTPEGYILWKSLQKLNLRLTERFYGRKDVSIMEGLKNPNKFVLLQVNNNHWVFLMGRWIPILGYRIADPWKGDTCYTNRYKNNITGGAVITK